MLLYYKEMSDDSPAGCLGLVSTHHTHTIHYTNTRPRVVDHTFVCLQEGCSVYSTDGEIMSNFSFRVKYEFDPDPIPYIFMASSYEEQCDWIAQIEGSAREKTMEVAGHMPAEVVPTHSLP